MLTSSRSASPRSGPRSTHTPGPGPDTGPPAAAVRRRAGRAGRAASTVRRLVSAVLCTVLATGFLVVGGGAAEARSINRVHHRWTSSWYFSQDLTRAMVTPAGVTSVVAGTLGGVAGRVVGGTSGIVAAKAAEAAGEHRCLRVRYVRLPMYPWFAVVGVHSDGSRPCWAR